MASQVLNMAPNCHKFYPDTSIPDLSSKVIIVTGGNNGIGKESVLQLAKHKPRRLYLTARSQGKFDAALVDVHRAVPEAKVDFLELDLASFSSIKKAADSVIANNDRLDVLLNNAGVMALPPGLTADGYEIQFGTNHIGHAFFTKLLMPLLLHTAAQPNSDVRIVNLTSGAERNAPKGGFLPAEVTTNMESYHTYTRYGQSKLANILFTRSLAEKYPQITSVAIHPGRVRSNLLTDFFEKGSFVAKMQGVYDALLMMPVEKGALTQLWGCVGKEVKTGTYYSPIGVTGAETKICKDMVLAEKLWVWQEAEFKRLGY